MRYGIVSAAAVAAIGFAALAPAGAQAQEYCGFLPHLGAMVQCGYSSLQDCEHAVGKGAMCFINPYLAMDTKRPAPASLVKNPTIRG
jgi:Protein of unknown function (DUF3551)